MTSFLLFAVLGVGTGVVYALLALGVVLIQKGTGAINFAHGAVAGTAAIYFAVSTNEGTPVPVAMALCVGVAALGGAAFYALVMRPLRTAPLLARIVSTLGLMVVLQGLAVKLWPNPSVVAPPLFPLDSVQMLGITLGVDRFWLLGVTVVITAALWAAYRFTTFGRATRATAESERGAMLLGYSPDLIGAANWAAGSALAAVAGVLIAPIATLDINTLSLLIIPALAAALVGRFNSFGVTAVTAVAIGVAQSLLTNYSTTPGITQAVPFVLVVGALLLRGRAIPERGGLSVLRDPEAVDGPFRLRTWGPLVLVAGIVIGIAPGTWQSAVTTSLVFVLLALSLVIVTGFVGQLSLAQMVFAGVGGFTTAKLATVSALPFPLPILLAGLVAVPIGVLLGVPALRVRGISLAVITLGAAATVSAMVFQNASLTGGVAGNLVPTPTLLGLSLDPVTHADRFGWFVLAVVTAAVAAVLTLRQSASGRRMLAVRANERAAAVSGIDVARTKLTAFALSAFVAGVGGSLLGYQLGAVSFDRFSPLASVMLVATVYIGGIATVRGAVLAGFIATGGVLYTWLTQAATGIDVWWSVISGVLLIVTVVTQPNGAVIATADAVRGLRTRRRPDASAADPDSPHHTSPRPRPARGDLSDSSAGTVTKRVGPQGGPAVLTHADERNAR